jgi:hypothetical protein
MKNLILLLFITIVAMSSTTARSYKLHEYKIGESASESMDGVVVMVTNTIIIHYSTIIILIIIDETVSTTTHTLEDGTVMITTEMMIQSIITNRRTGKVATATESCVLYTAGEELMQLVLRGTSDKRVDDLEFVFDAIPMAFPEAPQFGCGLEIETSKQNK